jgi:hypothetical protein
MNALACFLKSRMACPCRPATETWSFSSTILLKHGYSPPLFQVASRWWLVRRSIGGGVSLGLGGFLPRTRERPSLNVQTTSPSRVRWEKIRLAGDGSPHQVGQGIPPSRNTTNNEEKKMMEKFITMKDSESLGRSPFYVGTQRGQSSLPRTRRTCSLHNAAPWRNRRGAVCRFML